MAAEKSPWGLGYRFFFSFQSCFSRLVTRAGNDPSGHQHVTWENFLAATVVVSTHTLATALDRNGRAFSSPWTRSSRCQPSRMHARRAA